MFLSVLLLIVSLFTPTIPVEPWFTAPDVTLGDQFGAFMALSGDTVVVGNPRDSDQEVESGSMYVFVRDGDTWVLQQKIFPPTPSFNQGFGRALAISGDTIVTSGADSSVVQNGSAVYVFVRSGGTWSLQQKLTLPDQRDFEGFGAAVGIDGDTIVVTAPGDGDEVSLPGSVSVFTRESSGVWTMQQRCRVHDAAPNVLFGGSVAIVGETFLVSDEFYPTNNGRFVGGVYVFERMNGVWIERQKLQVSNSKAGADYGRAVAFDGHTIAVGAPIEEHGSNTIGSVYVYARSGGQWSQQQKLFVKDSEAQDGIGHSVAVDGARIIIGNLREDEQRGAAYIFTRDNKSNWSQQAKLVAADATPEAIFGARIVMDGSQVLIGAPGKTIDQPSSGAVYYTTLAP